MGFINSERLLEVNRDTHWAAAFTCDLSLVGEELQVFAEQFITLECRLQVSCVLGQASNPHDVLKHQFSREVKFSDRSGLELNNFSLYIKVC